MSLIESASDKTHGHSLESSAVLEKLRSQSEGLSALEAETRLQAAGPNRLPQQPPPALWQLLLRQFQSPLIYVLLAAAAVAILAGDIKDATFIGLVLAINACIGGYQEWQAERSSRALQKLLRIRASVLRDGELLDVDAEEIVPGDVVWLESGNRVPADLRLLSAHGLEIDESLLTGESVPVCKDAEQVLAHDTPMADRVNSVYAASIVLRGRAKGIVISTGTQTELGKLAIDMSSSGGKPPLLVRMEKFSQTIAYVVVVAVFIVSAIGYFVHGHTLHEMFLFGVALAVAAIPEGLPAALTVTLAVATTRMAQRGVIVRRLAAVEGLGSCTLIASDKTGTLTCNELTVREIRLADDTVAQVTGEGFEPVGHVTVAGQAPSPRVYTTLRDLADTAVLCNEAELHQRHGHWTWHGDPTDIALLCFGHKLGISRYTLLDQLPQVNQIPFEPEYRFAATFHQDHDQVRIAVKGAPERVLSMCHWSSPEKAQHFLQVALEMAERGYRVLAFAVGTDPQPISSEVTPPQPAELRFQGFVGMIDPLRPGVHDAIQKCHQAGITVCMVTGDHPVTALAISRELGLASTASQVVSGADLATMSDDQIQRTLEVGRVFARVAPRQKLELVKAAQKSGHYVAVTGDGVNDAPALRAANIGVAMGRSGTDVAREAAELVISDDNFATIVDGVEEGRVAYDNVRKVIYLLITTGVAEILLIAAAFIAGAYLPLPFLPVQLLWLNLVTNGIQGIALAFEPGEKGVLKRKPRRPSEPIFDRLMIERTLVAALTMALMGLAAFWWMVQAGWSDDAARNGLLLLMVLFENVHIGNCRSEHTSSLTLSPLKTPLLLFGALGALLIHVVAMHTPVLQSVLRTEPVDLTTWLGLGCLSLTVFIAIEIHKLCWKLRYPDSR